MSLLTYPGIWESVAAAGPDRRAQVQGERVITWGQFNRRANGLAQQGNGQIADQKGIV